MRYALTLPVLLFLLENSQAPAAIAHPPEIQGTAVLCSRNADAIEEQEYRWRYPLLLLPSRNASIAINAAVARDVQQALGIDSLDPGNHPCATTPDLRLSARDTCEVSYSSKAYVSLQCTTTEGYPGLGEGTEIRSLLFAIRHSIPAKLLTPGQLFSGDAAISAVLHKLHKYIALNAPEPTKTIPVQT